MIVRGAEGWCGVRTVPLAHALGAHSVVAARDTVEETLQDLDESGPYQARGLPLLVQLMLEEIMPVMYEYPKDTVTVIAVPVPVSWI